MQIKMLIVLKAQSFAFVNTFWLEPNYINPFMIKGLRASTERK